MLPAGREIQIRPYAARDRASVRHIAFATAFLERPTEFFDDEEILSDILTRYFTDYEPGSSFVAQTPEGEVVGYLIGALDTRRMDRISLVKVGPAILGKSLCRGTLGHGKVLRFLWHLFVSFCRGEFFLRDFSQDYPATFHINLLKDCRGQHVGEQLVAAFLVCLKTQGVKGVRVSTFSDGAKQFFEKVGMTVLARIPRSFLKYRTGKDATVYILGRNLREDACA